MRQTKHYQAVHARIQKQDYSPRAAITESGSVDDTVIQLDDDRFWPCVAVDPPTNYALHVRLYPRQTTAITEMFPGNSKRKRDAADARFLVAGAPWRQTALSRRGLRFQHGIHGNQNPANVSTERENEERIISKYVQQR